MLPLGLCSLALTRYCALHFKWCLRQSKLCNSYPKCNCSSDLTFVQTAFVVIVCLLCIRITHRKKKEGGNHCRAAFHALQVTLRCLAHCPASTNLPCNVAKMCGNECTHWKGAKHSLRLCAEPLEWAFSMTVGSCWLGMVTNMVKNTHKLSKAAKDVFLLETMQFLRLDASGSASLSPHD